MSVTISVTGRSHGSDPNFSNGNARQVFELIGIPFDEQDGEILGEHLNRVIKLATRVLNNESRDLSVPRTEDGRVIYHGTTDEHVRDRIRAVLKICVQAKAMGKSVTFG